MRDKLNKLYLRLRNRFLHAVGQVSPTTAAKLTLQQYDRWHKSDMYRGYLKKLQELSAIKDEDLDRIHLLNVCLMDDGGTTIYAATDTTASPTQYSSGLLIAEEHPGERYSVTFTSFQIRRNHGTYLCEGGWEVEASVTEEHPEGCIKKTEISSMVEYEPVLNLDQSVVGMLYMGCIMLEKLGYLKHKQ